MPSPRSTQAPPEAPASDAVQATIPMRGADDPADTAPTTPGVVGSGEPLQLQPSNVPGDLGRLGKFRILRVLGRGGMGMVYVGLDEALSRRLAIKVMNPGQIDDLTRERFLREARAAAVLSHDNIVPVFQVDEDNGTPYIVMPLLEGETLADRQTREGRFPVRDALRIARETLTGLAAAHDIGLVHRDVKPGNLFLEGARGRIRILDFGVAHQRSGAGRLTQNGFVVGTPAYMSPEQAHGRTVDGRADVFSVGAVLYECLVGRRPFPGDDVMAILTSLISVEPEPPSKIDKAIPKAVSDLCLSLLAKKPEDRPASARDAGRRILALERALAKPAARTPAAPPTVPAPKGVKTPKRTERAEEPPPSRSTRPKLKRRKKASLIGPGWMIAGLVAGALAMIGVGVGIAFYVTKEDPPAGPTTPTATKPVADPAPMKPAEVEAPAPAPVEEPWRPEPFPPPKGFPPPKKGFPPGKF